MNYAKNFFNLIDNYVIRRSLRVPSTASFWYLPEPPQITTEEAFRAYQQSLDTPPYFIDYRQKLNYSLQNEAGIIILPYHHPIGSRVNPEAAFQYALGCHSQFCLTKDKKALDTFLRYADYFVKQQTIDGLWSYDFDWYYSKAPWFSALAQSRGASVMLRAWLYTKDTSYLEAAKKALMKFNVPTSEGGFLHIFSLENCPYFEEYPTMPTGVINGFMAALINVWELNYWLKEKWLETLWRQGIDSLHAMLPHYSTGWWSLYDLDDCSPILNVNSPRYHLIEISYLQVLTLLSASPFLKNAYLVRMQQLQNRFFRLKAMGWKMVRKIMYR